MTTLEARKTYKELYIGFVKSKPLSDNTGFDNCVGKVLYTADTYIEQYDIPIRDENGKRITLIYGMGVKDLPSDRPALVYKSIDKKKES